MRQDERDTLRRRYHFRCGYCSVHEVDGGAILTVDHYQPRSAGGLDDPSNWVYCCHACNEFKGDWWQPDSNRHILHPLNDDLTAHFVELNDGSFGALTEMGEFHIARLQLNRPPLVAYRLKRRLRDQAKRQEDELLSRLSLLEAEVRSLTDRLERSKRTDA